MACDFDVSLRVIASDGTTVVKDFNDPDNGVAIESLQEPDESTRKTRVVGARVDGDFVVTEAADAGELIVIVSVEGSTWAQVASRWQSCRAAYRAEPWYFIEAEIEGVTTRYRTERPDVSSAATDASNLMARQQTYSIRWHVQPNPTVTV